VQYVANERVENPKSLHIKSKVLDFTGRVLMKFTISIISLTSFSSFCAIFVINTSRIKNIEFAQ